MYKPIVKIKLGSFYAIEFSSSFQYKSDTKNTDRDELKYYNDNTYLIALF